MVGPQGQVPPGYVLVPAAQVPGAAGQPGAHAQHGAPGQTVPGPVPVYVQAPKEPDLPPRRKPSLGVWRIINLVVAYTGLGLEVVFCGLTSLFGLLMFVLYLTDPYNTPADHIWMMVGLPVIGLLLTAAAIVFLGIWERREDRHKWVHGGTIAVHLGFVWAIVVVLRPWGTFNLVCVLVVAVAIAGHVAAMVFRTLDRAYNPEFWAAVDERAARKRARKLAAKGKLDPAASAGPAPEDDGTGAAKYAGEVPPWERGPARVPEEEPDPGAYDAFLDQTFTPPDRDSAPRDGR
ncbi:hypothetical protein [Brevibacterium litoralis]|uniref:hypothetical protein n=1 Tax=Brevibacterium litoralis TaxID=3138935 RepID=UPI0032EC523F